MAQQTGKLTLQDVAARAGVSNAAVSLALRGRPGVSEATRRRILAAADEIGYRAVRRATGRSAPGTVAVLLRDIVSVFSHDVVSGMEAAAADAGLRLMFFDGRGDLEHLRAEFDELRVERLQGIVTFGTAIPGEMLQKAAQRTPVVLVGKAGETVSGVDIVSNDDVLGARLAVRHLVECGHVRIAHLAKGGLRAEGYTLGMREAGLERYLQLEGGSTETLRPAIRYLLFSILQEENSPTAVFAETDGVAIDFLGAAVDAGLRVPEDISVVGYDSTRQCEMIRPRLTSVRQPRHEMGIAAIRLLRERAAGRSEDRDLVLEPGLDVRDSSVGPRTASSVVAPSSLSARYRRLRVR
ncbi:LacI family DNA-binding transcriptional regulator [Brachybacterium sp. YJGR34]|uniref:LacI family DNA-binding transcriptional regulator n=1 Tax=Brachybacterium sp. YJGR34 TaxID=2059911 RepID=UPI000E0A24BD|nr:LacI family DNA-binding transcriptional regulator [Brachybacterium sp. YJGR34]